MVSKEALAYLFIGQGSPAKDAQIKLLKEKILAKGSGYFNSDTVYGKELCLKELQERLLFFPLNSEKRVLTVRDTRRLKPEVKLFILRYMRNPELRTVLIFDLDKDNPKDDFLKSLKRYARVYTFTQDRPPEPFDLVRQIDRGNPAQGLKILNQLLKQGVKPEFILGALRFVSQQAGSLASKKITALLLNCDLEIKTGRLKSEFALEKLVVGLCAFRHFRKA